jgi:hypothetical protein
LPVATGIHIYRNVNANSATRHSRIALLSFRRVNDILQACIKSSQLASPRNFHASFYQGAKMDSITEISDEAVPATDTNLIINAVAIMCGLAVVVFACMATSGLDMSPGFF